MTTSAQMRNYREQTRKYHKQAVERALAQIEKDLFSTLEDVTAVSGYSIRRFSGIFRDVTGTTFKKYMQEARIRRAKKLLMETDKSIEGITFAIGYTSIESFRKIFNKQVGCYPEIYRSKAENNE